ncbi:MAG: uptake protein [Firmicutes bacterium]|nr:uptake protein [Bacillota bacterium]
MIEHDLWFSLLRISESTKLALLKKLNSAEAVWNYSRDNGWLLSGDKNEVKIKSKISGASNEKEIESVKKIVFNNEIKLVSYNDPSFPERLKLYADCPGILFYKGDPEKLNKRKNAAVVGSRSCTAYGRSAAAAISRDLCRCGINVVSGLAKGIDGAAHKSALANGGYTCGVLGCGLDVVYPRENIHLYNEMFRNGCVISEFIPGTRPAAFNFPKRNRIISGLSDVVIVVEAGEKSGSLITARMALDQNKSVFAVPGSIFSDRSSGANKLVRDGANIYTDLSDLSACLSLNFNIINGGGSTFSGELQSLIFDHLSEKPMHIDEIINITHIDIKQLYELLFELQLDNRILCLPGNHYIRAANE